MLHTFVLTLSARFRSSTFSLGGCLGLPRIISRPCPLTQSPFTWKTAETTATAQAWSRGLNQNHPDWCLRKALITKKRNHCTGPATAGAECAEPEVGVPVRSSHPASPAPRHRRARSGQAAVWMETPSLLPVGAAWSLATLPVYGHTTRHASARPPGPLQRPCLGHFSGDTK